MNNSIDVIKSIYKPYRYTIKGKVTILESTLGNLVVKEKENNLNELFSYLKSRNFYNYPEIIDSSRDSINVFKYIESIDNPKEQKANDIINIISDLHNKTSYYKDVTEDNYKIIYDDILNNINYLEQVYNKQYDDIYNEVMMSPSKYLFMRNYSKIRSNLLFCKNELNEWYNLVKNENKTRVSMVHNNLAIDHLIKNDKDYLISWEKAKVDTPILDIINFYHNEFNELNFDTLLSNYMNKFHLNDSEKKLLFIMISIPYEIKFTSDELHDCKLISNILDYIYKTEELIRPYYTEQKKE